MDEVWAIVIIFVGFCMLVIWVLTWCHIHDYQYDSREKDHWRRRENKMLRRRHDQLVERQYEREKTKENEKKQMSWKEVQLENKLSPDTSSSSDTISTTPFKEMWDGSGEYMIPKQED